MPVWANEFDPDRLGSINVTLAERDDKNPIVGAELAVYRVADVEMQANGKLKYIYTDAFATCGISLNDASLATKLDAFVAGENMESVKIVTDENGKAICADLPIGLYLVKQIGNVEGYAPCTPFMVTLPYQTDSGYDYDVDATPKTDVMRLITITIKKVWNTDESTKAADSVTVQLLHNGSVIKTVTLNDANNWTATVDDVPKSDGYTVKEENVPKGFTATYTQKGYEFTVTNTSSLIQTGQLVWPIPVLAVSGVFLILLGTMFLMKKRKTDA